MSISPPNNVLDRVLEPFTGCLTHEVAQKIIDMRADPDAQERVDELADKANEGILTADECSEYRRYREAFHLITVLQAKARNLLKGHPST